MKKYEDINSLPISMIKQFAYCKRRFSLMYIDSQWGSNYKIVEGDFVHSKVDDPFFNEKRAGIHNSRSLPVYSKEYHLYGVADIVEFIKDDKGVVIDKKHGLWRINPIEYKNGKPEKSNSDMYQLCAIAICLEEMFSTEIQYGDIYYNAIKKRKIIDISDELREKTVHIISQIWQAIDDKKLLGKPENQNCSLCSLKDICLPNIFDYGRGFKDSIL